jgi:hypothetical protein
VKDESHDVRYGTWIKKGCRDKNIDGDGEGSMDRRWVGVTKCIGYTEKWEK